MSERLASYQLLRSGNKVALQHETNDAPLAARNLTCYVTAHYRLASMVFIAVGVAAIDHHIGPESSF
jgi:hypothetical protein